MLSRLFPHARLIGLAFSVAITCLLSACADRPDDIGSSSLSPTASSSALLSASLATLTPSVRCSDAAQFIQDLSVPDGSHLRPGTPVTKTWQVRNTGTCTWTPDYQLKFIGGSPWHGSIVPLAHSVKPNGLIDISIALTAPITAGGYRERWRLFATDSTPFGPTLFVDIVVP